MTQKKRNSYHVDRWYQRPANKRNRTHSDRSYPSQPNSNPHQQQQQQYNSQHQYQYHPHQQTAVDPSTCTRALERLSLSHQNFPPLNNRTPSGTQPKLPAVDNSRRRKSDTFKNKTSNPSLDARHRDHTVSHPARSINSHPEHPPFNRNHQAFPGKAYQFHHGSTNAVKRDIHCTGNSHKIAGRRNPWNSTQKPTNRSAEISQPFTQHTSRPIATLPQPLSRLTANRFATLCSAPIDQVSLEKLAVARQASTRMPQLQPNQTATRRKNYPVTIDDDGYQIDIVLDTNILLAYQHFLQALIPLLEPNCRLLVPAAVISELDVQKTRQRPVEVFEAGRCSSHQLMSSLARQVTNWLLALVKLGSSSIVLQKLDEESDEDKRDKDADTRILMYTHKLYLQSKSHHPGTVIALLSNDNILRLRAQSEGICTVAMADFRHSPRQILGYIRQIVSNPRNPAIPAPTNPLLLNHPQPNHPQPRAKRSTELNPMITSHQTALKLCLPSNEDGQFTFTSPLPSTSQSSDSANQSNQPIVASGPDRQFIFTLPSSSPPPLAGPDQELDRLKSQILKARPCRSCKSVIESAPQVSPDQIHHYCPMCCEVICNGCMHVTGCDWDCSGPFHGHDCQTIKCCATGRASIWIELFGQLDACFLMNQYKISFKHGPKITHLYGDEALIQYLNAAYTLLIASGDDDERLGFLRSLLISSTLIDVLSQTFLSSPMLSWHFRSELFLSAIKLVRGILEKLSKPWEILNSEFVKSSTSCISPFDRRQYKVVWHKVSEKEKRPNSTDVKVQRLQRSLPGLMADVQEILHNRPASTSATIRRLLDNAACVPLCYVLEQLFRLAIEMETQQSDHFVTLPGDIQVTVPLSRDLVRMTSALLDLQIVYESHLKTHASDTDSNDSAYDGQTGEAPQHEKRDASKQQGSQVKNGPPRINGVNSSNKEASNTKPSDKVDNCLEASNEKKTQSKSEIKLAKQTRSANHSRCVINGPGDSNLTKISDEVDELSISSLDSESSDHTSDIIVLN